MAKFCPVCNKELSDESTFCSVCGASLEGDPAEDITQNDNAGGVTAQTDNAPKEKKEELFPAVSTATFFWLNIAMNIPFVGFVLSIILTCAPRNRSLKNFSKSYLIAKLIVIGIFTSGIIVALILAAIGTIPALSGDMGVMSGMAESLINP